jgi:hypothetical protein
MSKRIKAKIGEEKYNKLKELLGDDIRLDDIDIIPNNYVTKNRFDEVNTENNSNKQKLTSFENKDKSIKKLLEDTNSENVENLVNSYKSLETTHKDEIKNIQSSNDNEITNLKKSYMVKDFLRDNGVTKSKNVDLLFKSINLENIKLENDKLIGASDILKSMKEDYSELFTKTKLDGKPPKDTNNLGGDDSDNPDAGSGDIFDQLVQGYEL